MSSFLAKTKAMLFPGEFILDSRTEEIKQVSSNEATAINSLLINGASHIKSIVCSDCQIKSATDIYKNEYCCSTCKSKKQFGL